MRILPRFCSSPRAETLPSRSRRKWRRFLTWAVQVPDMGGAGSEIVGAGFKTQPRPAPRICLLHCSDGAGSAPVLEPAPFTVPPAPFILEPSRHRWLVTDPWCGLLPETWHLQVEARNVPPAPKCDPAFLDAHFEAFLLFSTCWSISGCAFCRDFALLHVLEHFWMRILPPFCSSPRAETLPSRVKT